MDFTISNHPTLSTVTRTASLQSMSVDNEKKQVTLSLNIRHYLDGIEIPELNKRIESIGDNSVQKPFPTEENPENTIGEYDYWMLAYEANTPLNQMLAVGIQGIDESGLVNSKCNYAG